MGGIVNQPALADLAHPARRAIVTAGGTDLGVGDGGTGVSSLTDGGIMLGSGNGAVTVMARLTNSQMVVGQTSGDPVIESGATLRTSIGVGTGDSPQFTGIELGHASDTTLTRPTAGNLAIEGNRIHRVGGTDVGIADGGTGASDAATAATNLGLGTGDNPQFTGVNVGHATDTTLARASAGNLTVEGNALYRAGGTDVPVADGGTGASSHTDGGLLIGKGVGAIENTGEMADSTFVVGDGTTNPVVENAATARTSMGIANHDSIVVSADGEAINTEQPCFLVTPSSNQTNIAVGSDVTVVWGTEITDQNADFASNAFTASVTGNYLIACLLRLDQLDTAADSYLAKITTSNREYQILIDPGGWSADQFYSLCLSAVADMDAADTAIIEINQTAGTQQTDVLTTSTFSGCLLT